VKPTIHPTPDESTWLDLRRRNINSSEVAALFGMSPYLTEYEMWNVKAGELEDGFVSNDRVEAGQFLEAGIAAWAAHKLGVEARPFKDYYELADARTGSSFDWEIPEWRDAPEGFDGPGIMEVKNVDFLQFTGSFKAGYSDRKWNADDPDNILMPPHIELQVQHQLMVSGRKWAVIAVLVGGNDLRFVFRRRREDIIQKIATRIAKFWESIDENICPDPDITKDHDTLKRLYAVSDPRAALDEDLHAEVQDAIAKAAAAGEQKRNAEAEEKIHKTRLMKALGDVELAVLPDGSKVSWKTGKRGRTMRLTAAPVPASPTAEDASDEAA